MKLKIKEDNKEEIGIITLREDDQLVEVLINGEQIAIFWNNGKFTLHGVSDSDRFNGRWDKK